MARRAREPRKRLGPKDGSWVELLPPGAKAGFRTLHALLDLGVLELWIDRSGRFHFRTNQDLVAAYLDLLNGQTSPSNLERASSESNTQGTQSGRAARRLGPQQDPRE